MTSKLAKIETHTSEVVTPQMAVFQAYEKGADPEVLEKLLALQERFEEREARKSFIQAMNKFRSNVPEIKKDKHVNYSTKSGVTDYWHASLNNISKTISPILSEYGLSFRWNLTPEASPPVVMCIIEHIDGHKETTSMSGEKDTTGGKNGIQGSGSTITYLQRYTLVSALGLTIDDQDDDGNGFGGSLGPINEVQKQDIIKLIKETNTDTQQFLRFMKHPSIDEIPANEYNKAMESLNAKKRKAAQ